MKRKTLKAAIAFAAMLGVMAGCFTACEREEVAEVQSGGRAFPSRKTITMSDAQREEYAKRLAMYMAVDSASFHELHNAVSIVRSYGVDEFVTFYDIKHPDLSVFLPNGTPLDHLRGALDATQIIPECGLTQENYYANLLLYWPYHTDWDGTTVPFVVFTPVNSNQTQFMGFRYVNGVMEFHLFDLRRIEEGSIPMIVINENEFDYCDYPDFKNGVRYKNHFIWIRVEENGSFGDSFETDLHEGRDSIYRATMCGFKSSGTQYDSWFAGGSEFSFTFARVYADGTIDTVSCIIPLTRKQISNHTKVNLDMIIHSNWQQECGDVFYYFCEHDDWGSLSTVSFDLTIAGVTVSGSIDINTTDDLIAKGKITRDDFFDKCQTEGGKFKWGLEEIFCKLKAFSKSIY